jgi:hypothetical protein
MIDPLGYTQHPDGSWEPIEEIKQDIMYSSGMIVCSRCGKWIRDRGGPMLGCVCVTCYLGDLNADKETD